MGDIKVGNKQKTFAALVENIQAVHRELTLQAGKAVNISVTLRNWLIGFYIAEYELHGKDRAEYGDSLLTRLSESLAYAGIGACGKRQLYWYLRFYQVYPQIVRSLPAEFQIHFTPDVTEPQKLLQSLSYTHFEQLITIDDHTKRSFYEIECIRGNWSVRELKRQMGSLYYERSGLSKNKKKLSALANSKAEKQLSFDIRDPYIFEFLGLKPAEVMSESHLEQQLTDKLQEFLLELGNGFCFEARQKRILIGDEHFFVDLVFYHRILKCHVLVELKLAPFNHECLGQLNTYVNWYRVNMMAGGDNAPVGILLCTDKNHALVEYALAGMDNKLFVSKYQLELPRREEMQRFIEGQLREAGGVKLRKRRKV